MGQNKRLMHDGKISAMTADSSTTAKQELRKVLVEARKSNSAANSETRLGLARQLESVVSKLGGFAKISSVASYLPFGTEPDISLFNQKVLDAGCQLLLPVSNADSSLTWIDWSGSETHEGIFGFAEPVGQVADIRSANLIVIPALACDRQGNRLGKGKGYYDRELAGVATPKVAVIFSNELVATLQVEPHDQKVDFVVTPQQALEV